MAQRVEDDRKREVFHALEDARTQGVAMTQREQAQSTERQQRHPEVGKLNLSNLTN